MNDIYFLSYQRSDGQFVFACVESHCRLAAMNEAVLSEARLGMDIVCGTAELMCPAQLLRT